jgi:hypothetical protein
MATEVSTWLNPKVAGSIPARAIARPPLSDFSPRSCQARARSRRPLHTIRCVSGQQPNAAYLTDAVHRDELPILLVIHEEDGDWQFLDGGDVDNVEAVAVHIEHVFEKHPDLRLLTDLPKGWAAERNSTAGAWRRYPWQPE